MPGGAADVDGRLQVGDEITHINSYSVMDAPHRNVISAMGEAAAQGEVVLKIRRKMPMPGQLLGMSLYVRTKCDRACIDHSLQGNKCDRACIDHPFSAGVEFSVGSKVVDDLQIVIYNVYTHRFPNNFFILVLHVPYSYPLSHAPPQSLCHPYAGGHGSSPRRGSPPTPRGA